MYDHFFSESASYQFEQPLIGKDIFPRFEIQ